MRHMPRSLYHSVPKYSDNFILIFNTNGPLSCPKPRETAAPRGFMWCMLYVVVIDPSARLSHFGQADHVQIDRYSANPVRT